MSPEEIARATCAREYKSNSLHFFMLSLAPATFLPRHHVPGNLADEIQANLSRKMLDAESEKQAVDDDAYMSAMFDAAEQQLFACWSHGHRYWENEMQLARGQAQPHLIRKLDSLLDSSAKVRGGLYLCTLGLLGGWHSGGGAARSSPLLGTGHAIC
eukprot:TRINITY_DN20030_c0_g1_i2.p1 TRINITY_DN20030_c0_g1~~TRINITY_DN20030_c0_g1_i2.p1  ORF type:complete len:157 (+),score=31.32 TRINITY_DN20030_c0_g1_i2:141-611(+)